MPRRSAALLVYRWTGARLDVLVAHMGGPLWARKDAGAWSIPKGELEPGEEPLAAAVREFTEEMGSPPPAPADRTGYLRLPDARQSNKIITTFAVEGSFDAATAQSNTFELEWPPGSGKIQHFPEMDRAEWYDVDTARVKVVKGQVAILDALREAVEPS